MFSLVSVCLSTPPAGQATYAAGGMPLAFSQDFLVLKMFSQTNTSYNELISISCICLQAGPSIICILQLHVQYFLVLAAFFLRQNEKW